MLGHWAGACVAAGPRSTASVDVLTGQSGREAVPRTEAACSFWSKAFKRRPRSSRSSTVDHVIAMTGFRIDIARLPFLPERAAGEDLDGQRYLP